MKENIKECSTKIDGGVNEEQIAAWHAKHRKIICIEVVDGDELHAGYFHRPDLQTMSAVAKIVKTDEVKSAETMFDNCWLGGSPYLRQDAILFMEATTQLSTLFKSCFSSLKNV